MDNVVFKLFYQVIVPEIKSLEGCALIRLALSNSVGAAGIHCSAGRIC